MLVKKLLLSSKCAYNGAIQELHNAMGDGVSNFKIKALRRCTVQHYWRYEGVGGGQISRKNVVRNT